MEIETDRFPRRYAAGGARIGRPGWREAHEEGTTSTAANAEEVEISAMDVDSTAT
jgi:hypothetical protein